MILPCSFHGFCPWFLDHNHTLIALHVALRWALHVGLCCAMRWALRCALHIALRCSLAVGLAIRPYAFTLFPAADSGIGCYGNDQNGPGTFPASRVW